MMIVIATILHSSQSFSFFLLPLLAVLLFGRLHPCFSLENKTNGVIITNSVIVGSVPTGNSNNASATSDIIKSRDLYQIQHQKYLPKDHLMILDQNQYRHYLDHLIKHRRLNSIEEVERNNPDLGSSLSYWDYIAENAPFFDSPDKIVERAFYFRIFTYLRHIKKRKNITETSKQPQYVITEFLNPVPWEGANGAIACSAGHHFREGRWLHQPAFLESYARFWLNPSTLSNPRQYSFWIADSILSLCKNTGNFQLAVELLPGLVKNFQAIEVTNFNSTLGLFFNTDNRDGMEWSISGTTEIRGYRPTLNSYMYGEAMAISKIAKLAGKTLIHSEFRDKAKTLKSKVESILWDHNTSFYKVLHYKKQVLSNARELHGYSPWYMNMYRTLDTNQTFKTSDYSIIFGRTVDIQRQRDVAALSKLKAWRELIDPQGFNAAAGLTTAEQRHKQFRAEYCKATEKSSTGMGQCHECQWNGPVWPFATSMTLTAMSQAMNQYEAIVKRAQARFMYLKELHSIVNNETRLSALIVNVSADADANLSNPPANDATSVSHRRRLIGSIEGMIIKAVRTGAADLSLVTDIDLIRSRVEHLFSNEQNIKIELNAIDNYLSKARYFRELKKYATSHKRKAEKTNTFISWIDENQHPTTGDWMSRTMLSTWENSTWSTKKGGKERGKDYNHSTFLDLIISGLFGFRALGRKSFEFHIRIPDGLWHHFCLDQLKYRDSYITILYDEEGERYHQGPGFKVFVDKRLVYSSKVVPSGRVAINYDNIAGTHAMSR